MVGRRQGSDRVSVFNLDPIPLADYELSVLQILLQERGVSDDDIPDDPEACISWLSRNFRGKNGPTLR